MRHWPVLVADFLRIEDLYTMTLVSSHLRSTFRPLCVAKVKRESRLPLVARLKDYIVQFGHFGVCMNCGAFAKGAVQKIPIGGYPLCFVCQRLDEFGVTCTKTSATRNVSIFILNSGSIPSKQYSYGRYFLKSHVLALRDAVYGERGKKTRKKTMAWMAASRSFIHPHDRRLREIENHWIVQWCKEGAVKRKFGLRRRIDVNFILERGWHSWTNALNDLETFDLRLCTSRGEYLRGWAGICERFPKNIRVELHARARRRWNNRKRRKRAAVRAFRRCSQASSSRDRRSRVWRRSSAPPGHSPPDDDS